MLASFRAWSLLMILVPAWLPDTEVEADPSEPAFDACRDLVESFSKDRDVRTEIVGYSRSDIYGWALRARFWPPMGGFSTRMICWADPTDGGVRFSTEIEFERTATT
jgi:hypothetical protein